MFTFAAKELKIFPFDKQISIINIAKIMNQKKKKTFKKKNGNG